MYAELASSFLYFLADPKSQIFKIWQLGSMRRFWGLISLWITPSVWIYARPLKSWYEYNLSKIGWTGYPNFLNWSFILYTVIGIKSMTIFRILSSGLSPWVKKACYIFITFGWSISFKIANSRFLNLLFYFYFFTATTSPVSAIVD